MRQQHRGRHVADDLAGGRAGQQRVIGHRLGQHRFDRGDARHIAREHEEADEGEQQPEVHRAQGATVEHEQAGYHGDERNRIRNQAKHRGDDHQKQRAERDGATTVDRGDVGSREVPPLRRPPFGSAGRRLREQGAAQADEQHRHGKGQRHGSKEVRQRDVEPLEQVEVLRVSERHDHAAEIRRQALHDEREGKRAFPPRFEQSRRTEGQHHDESHVVRGDHRQHQRDAHDGRDGRAAGGETRHHRASRCFEHARVAQRTDKREDAEQASERFKIEVAQIGGVGRHDQHGGRRGERRHEQHRVGPREAQAGRSDAGARKNAPRIRGVRRSR